MNHIVTNIHHPDPLSAVRKNQEGIENPSVEEKTECNECQWRYRCAGGCPLLTYFSDGGYNKKSPNCNIYKTLLPELMRLEGLILLNNYNSRFTDY